MLGLQADFLLQLAVHGLRGGLAVLDSALRELPGVLVDALAPEHLVSLVCKDDADIGTVAIAIEHTIPPL